MGDRFNYCCSHHMGLYTGSQYAKMVLFLGVVALLAYVGSWIILFVIYISYGAIILILILSGVMLLTNCLDKQFT